MEREHPHHAHLEREHPNHPELESDDTLKQLLEQRAARFFERTILPIDPERLASYESCEELLDTLAKARQDTKQILDARHVRGLGEIEYAKDILMRTGSKARSKAIRKLKGSSLTGHQRESEYDKQESIAKEKKLNQLGTALWCEEHASALSRLQELVRERRDTFEPRWAQEAA